MNSLKLRQAFFTYFKKRGHEQVQSSSLIPAQDPTLLFANAGMNQFKDLFLGLEKHSYSRAVSIQKCIRAGGKHNDLDNVGFTKRHLTFFEMMGNFSFDDYFKKEAIEYAWEFLTQEIHLNPSVLYVSVYLDDIESYAIWKDIIGLPEDRIIKLGKSDNFWQMGDTGPCGPCSEIYVDRGISESACTNSACAPGCSCDRFLEIWNLVFMQYDRQADGTDVPLKQKGVDTGMGLERLCTIVQDTDSVYETDLFIPVIKRIEKITGITYKDASADIKAACRVLADHSRSVTFALADGCTPSNEGRGYVVRKIIRRAALFAQKITDKHILPELADSVIAEFSSLYPELAQSRHAIKEYIKTEVEKFSINLINGQSLLKKYIADNHECSMISGEQAFKLYDTYGFPLELTQLIAYESSVTVDLEAFDKAMKQQKVKSGKKMISHEDIAISDDISTTFVGYNELTTSTTIIALIYHNECVSHVPEGELCFIITEKSPLYVECGGQVSDTALIMVNDKQAEIGSVKKIHNALAFECIAPIDLVIDQRIIIAVNRINRFATMKNHTATHILQAALKQIVGAHIKQSGSLVTPDYLRFDFTHHGPLSNDEIMHIETLVNRIITDNIPVSITNTTYKKAVSAGVTAFFGEKYNPDDVRIVEIPGFSAELCGGTHVYATGDIGVFKITENSAPSAGVRRIVAVTGSAALKLFQETFLLSKQLTHELKVPANALLSAVTAQKRSLEEGLQRIKKLKKDIFKSQIPELIARQRIIQDGIPFIYAFVPDTSMGELKEYADILLSRLSALFFMETNVINNKKSLLIVSSLPDDRVDMKRIAQWLKNQGIKGGGTHKHVQATGIVPDNIVDLFIKSLSQTNYLKLD